MDLLHTCYRSYMRLYPDDPDRLTLGRWVWCPAGAEYLPFEHSFLSSKWDPFSWRVDPDIGEVRGIVGYSSGKITPRFTGQSFCGAVILYQEGSPLDLMGTPAVDADGVPLCCDAPPPVGGLAMGGEGIVDTWLDIPLWLRPEELSTLSEGDRIDLWPRAVPTSRDGISDDFTRGHYHIDPATGIGGALYANVDPPGGANRGMQWEGIGVEDWSLYLVMRTPVGGTYAMSLTDFIAVTFGLLLTDTDVGTLDQFGGGIDLTGQSPDAGTLHVWGTKRESDQWSVWRDGVMLGTGTGTTDGFVFGFTSYYYPNFADNSWWMAEILIYDFAVTGAADRAVWDYLIDKYSGDVDTLELHILDPLELKSPGDVLILR